MRRRLGFADPDWLVIAVVLTAVFIPLTLSAVIRLRGAGYSCAAVAVLVPLFWCLVFVAFVFVGAILKALFFRRSSMAGIVVALIVTACGVVVMFGLCVLLWDFLLGPLVRWIEG